MKKILLLIFIMSFIIKQAQAQKQDKMHGISNKKAWKENDIVYLFGDQVKFREDANTEASNKVLDTLAMGAKLRVIDISPETYKYQGLDYP